MTDSASVVTVGVGRMGRGIAVAYALRGRAVVLLDLKRRSAADGAAKRAEVSQEVRDEMGRLVDLGLLSADDADARLSHVSIASENEAASILAGAGLVYEAVPETIEAKRDALGRIAQHARVDTLIASTTSTILASELAQMVPTPERFLNAHWLNPAFVVPLVEISAHDRTQPEVVSWMFEHLEAIGKVPVVCGSRPGYIVPRLQTLIMNEAARMVEEGVATPAEIDKATRFGLGFRFASMGVLEFIDYGGFDTLHHANGYLSKHVDSARYTAPEILAQYMASGRGGLHDGQGFHEYSSNEEAYRKDALGRSLSMLRHVGLSPVDSEDDVPR